LDDLVRDRQTQPEACTSLRSVGAAASLPVPLEQARYGVGTDATTRVPHRQYNLRSASEAADLDFAARWREANGVGEQIPGNLLEALGICAQRAGIRREIGDYCQAFVMRDRAEGVDHHRHHWSKRWDRPDIQS